MEQRDKILEEYYAQMGIAKPVYDFCMKVEEELKDRFEQLPYRKVMFVNKPDEKHGSCYYLKGFENDDCVGIITDSIGWKGMRPIDQFDYVRFLDGKDFVE